MDDKRYRSFSQQQKYGKLQQIKDNKHQHEVLFNKLKLFRRIYWSRAIWLCLFWQEQ